MSQKSIFDMDENIVAAFSYLLGPFSGILVLVLEKNNKFVRFHALQSTLWFLMLMVGSWVLTLLSSIFGGLPLLGTLLGWLFSAIFSLGVILYIGSKIYLIIKALQTELYKLPIIGEVVWAQVSK